MRFFLYVFFVFRVFIYMLQAMNPLGLNTPQVIWGDGGWFLGVGKEEERERADLFFIKWQDITKL